MVQVLGGERRILLGGLRGRKGHSLILAAACSLACLAVLGRISMSGEMWGGDGGATMLVGGGAAGAAAALPQFDEAAAAAKCQALTSRSSCMREPLNPDRRARFARLCFYDRRARTCKISSNYGDFFSITQPRKILSRYLSPPQRSARGRRPNQRPVRPRFGRYSHPRGGSRGRSQGIWRKGKPPSRSSRQPRSNPRSSRRSSSGGGGPNQGPNVGAAGAASAAPGAGAAPNEAAAAGGGEGAGNDVEDEDEEGVKFDKEQDDNLEDQEEQEDSQEAKDEEIVNNVLGDLTPSYSSSPHHEESKDFDNGEPYGGLRQFDTVSGVYVHHNFSVPVWERWKRHHARRKRVEWCSWGEEMVPCAPGFGGAWYVTGHRWPDKGIWYEEDHYHPDDQHLTGHMNSHGNENGHGPHLYAGRRSSDYWWTA